jgi:hypothetical protein
MFKRPTTDEKPKITTMWIKFGSFLNTYLLMTKIKLIPISEETKPVPKVVSSPVKVVSELNDTSNAEITFLSSTNELSGRPVAIKDKLFFKKLAKSLNKVYMTRTLVK